MRVIKLFVVVSAIFLTSVNAFSYSLNNDSKKPNSKSGSGYKIGNYSYFNANDGTQYTSYSIGDFDYTTGSDGYSGSGYSIGDFYYWND